MGGGELRTTKSELTQQVQDVIDVDLAVAVEIAVASIRAVRSKFAQEQQDVIHVDFAVTVDVTQAGP